MTSQQDPHDNQHDDNGHGGGHGHEVTIIVNGRRKTVLKDELTFEEVVALAELPSGADITYTVTYRRGEDHHPEGTLVAGQSVKVKEGMVFNVTATNKS